MRLPKKQIMKYFEEIYQVGQYACKHDDRPKYIIEQQKKSILEMVYRKLRPLMNF